MVASGARGYEPGEREQPERPGVRSARPRYEQAGKGLLPALGGVGRHKPRPWGGVVSAAHHRHWAFNALEFEL
jgi:hypothetical protein